MSLFSEGLGKLAEYSNNTEKKGETLIKEMIASKNLNTDKIDRAQSGYDICKKNLEETLVIASRMDEKVDKFFEKEKRFDSLAGVGNERKVDRTAIREKS